MQGTQLFSLLADLRVIFLAPLVTSRDVISTFPLDGTLS